MCLTYVEVGEGDPIVVLHLAAEDPTALLLVWKRPRDHVHFSF